MCETHACVRHRHVSDTRMYARRHVAKWHVPTCTNMSQHVNDEGGHQEIVVGVLVACRVWARHMEDSERDKRGPGGRRGRGTREDLEEARADRAQECQVLSRVLDRKSPNR